MSNTRPTIAKHRKPCDLPSPESTKSFWHTQPSALLLGHRSTRNLPKTADVVVVGSGITGSSVAHHLLTSGDKNQKLDVVLLEAREACWGATGRVWKPSRVNLYWLTSSPEWRSLPTYLL